MVDSSIMTAALSALCEVGLLVDSIEFDGVLHRVPTSDKPNNKNGAYIAHGDAPVSVYYQNWRSGESGTWTAKGQDKFTKVEREAFSRRIEESRKARETEQARVYTEAASKAQSIYAAAMDCTEHPYLERKSVTICHGLKLHKSGSLIVPAYDEAGNIPTLQFILPQKPEDGRDKNFLTGGRKKGCYFPIGNDAAKPLIICEGLATGLSLHECLGWPVLVAFDAGNLQPVAELARARHPEREIILAADYDDPSKHHPTPGGTGLAKAQAAAVAIGGSLAIPRWEGRAVDWNDLHQKMGAGEVRVQFMMHQPPENEPIKATNNSEALPPGFSLRPGGTRPGLWHTEHKEDGDPVETWIGPPLRVLGMTRDENNNSWGLLLEWHDSDGILHTWAMPQSMLAGRDNSAWLSRLADEGWRGNPQAKAKTLLGVFLAVYQTKQRVRCVPCTGWHHGAFVFPDSIIQNPAGRAGHAGQPNGENDLNPSSNETGLLDVLDGERIVLQTPVSNNPYRVGGTLDGWRASIGEWSRGNSRLMLAVCASLAAPLLEICGQDSGGFNITGQSSTGKTTALIAAGSVWGKGASSGGYVQSWRSTSNGLEGLAANHNDAAMLLDEIGQAPPYAVKEAAYMLANGMGKTRARQDGSARTAKSWRCMVLSTGEKGLAEKIAEEGGKVQAGQLVRLVDVPADAGAGMGIFENIHGHESPRAFADAIKRASVADYGHAARAFIVKVQEGREQLQKDLHVALDSAVKKLCPAEASGQVQRVARRFALCAAAGEMSVEWGLLSWEKGEALAAVKTCFEAWLVHRGGSGAAEDTAILEQVALFIEQHGLSRFQDTTAPLATCINRAGFRQDAGNGTKYYVLPENFKAEICKGVNYKRAAALLLDKGILIPGDSRSYTSRPPIDLPGYGRRRCYTLFFGGDADDMA